MGALDKLFSLISPTYEKATTREEDMTNLYNQLSTDNEEQSIEKQLGQDSNKVITPIEIEREQIEKQQKAPPQKDALVEELLAQNTEELSDMYETMMAGAGEFGTGEYKGPTKKQLGLTPKVIVDEVPQDFVVKEKPVPTLPTEGQEKNKFEPKPGQIIPDFSSREPAVTEEPKSELQQKKDILNEIYINDNIENINMFKQYAAPFNNRTVGKAYVSNVLDTVSSYIPDTFDKNKLKSLLMHTADKESKFGSDEGTHEKKDIEGGTVGHGGIQQVTTRGFRNNLIFNPGPTARRMIEQLKKEKGIDVNSFMKTPKGTDLESRIAINDFLRTPFGSNFAASIFYLNALDNPGKSGDAARKLFNSDKYNEKDFRDIYYKGSKTWKDVSSILKDDNIKESKRGGMIESDPYKRQPRFI